MDEQLTFRLPRDVARLLARRARERRVPRSQLVREALTMYLASPGTETDPIDAHQRIAPFLGAVTLDRASMDQDALTRQIRRHNWRD